MTIQDLRQVFQDLPESTRGAIGEALDQAFEDGRRFAEFKVMAMPAADWTKIIRELKGEPKT